MNRERILALADIIEKQPHAKIDDVSGFNMASWEHSCGTPCCIGGFAEKMAGDEGLELRAEKYLDLPDREAGLLFYPADFEGSWFDITPAHAAAALRHLAEAGVVDWSVTSPSESSPLGRV